jgi:hypothetical protein
MTDLLLKFNLNAKSNTASCLPIRQCRANSPRLRELSFFLIFLCFFLLVGPISWAAPVKCSDLFDTQLTKESERIHQFRLSQLGKTTQKIFVINKAKYTVQGLLGESSSLAFLAEDPSGNLVTIKERTMFYEGSNAPLHAYYEWAATLFYLENGISVPHVIDVGVEPNSILMVKSYVEGLTKEEIQIHADLVSADLKGQILDDATRTEDYLSDHVFGGRWLGSRHKPSRFNEWLKINKLKIESENPRLAQLAQLMSRNGEAAERGFEDLANRGDVRSENLLWIPQQQRWMLFDP